MTSTFEGEAERYQQHPDEVAAAVLIGNIAAVLVIPIVLAVILYSARTKLFLSAM